MSNMDGVEQQQPDNNQHNNVSSSSIFFVPSSSSDINNVVNHELYPWKYAHLEQQKPEIGSTSTRPVEPEIAVAAISSQAEDESSDEESDGAPPLPEADKPAQTQQPDVFPPQGQRRRWTNQLEFMKNKMLPYLLRKKEARHFRQPMTAGQLKPPHYFEAVRYPMDFGTIRQRLNNRYYRSGSECVDDIMRIFINANTYKPSPSILSKHAQFMETAFQKKMMDMPKVEEEIDVVPAQAKPKKKKEPEVEFDPAVTGRDHRGVSTRVRKPVQRFGLDYMTDNLQTSTSAQARELERWKRSVSKSKASSKGEAGASSAKAPKPAKYSDAEVEKKLGNENKEEKNGEVVQEVDNEGKHEETSDVEVEKNPKVKDMQKTKDEADIEKKEDNEDVENESECSELVVDEIDDEEDELLSIPETS